MGIEGSWASSDAARRTMQANRSRDTSPELAVRSRVHAAGLRYLVDRRLPVPRVRRGDLVFPRARVAVFVDGCFWHGCPQHHSAPRTNAGFWSTKVERNRERDRETDELLLEAGWLSLRAWEHEDPDEVAARVIETVRSRRTP